MKVPAQPVVNIGVVGHVDHGKSTLTERLTGERTDRHSEEIKRGISIRLGYADLAIYKCPKCEPPQNYSASEVCKHCGSKGELRRIISFVDSPGHETLMATMLSGAAIMDGALLVIPAAAARNAARGTAQAFWGAVAVSLVSGIAGIAASYALDTATGATVVLFASALFAVTTVARRVLRHA